MGFEPTDGSAPSAVFKTAALNRSAISPMSKTLCHAGLCRKASTETAPGRRPDHNLLTSSKRPPNFPRGNRRAGRLPRGQRPLQCGRRQIASVLELSGRAASPLLDGHTCLQVRSRKGMPGLVEPEPVQVDRCGQGGKLLRERVGRPWRSVELRKTTPGTPPQDVLRLNKGRSFQSLCRPQRPSSYAVRRESFPSAAISVADG